MIRMLADVDFEGDYGSAHTFADAGGDILRTGEWDSNFYVDWCVRHLELSFLHLYLPYNPLMGVNVLVAIILNFLGMYLQKI